MTTARGIGWALASTMAFAPLALACAASNSPAFAADASSANDAGIASDATAIDTGRSLSVSDGGPPDGPEEGRSNPGAYAAACLDGRGLDCANPSCAAAASCCVGRSTMLCCTTAAGAAIDVVFACPTAPCPTLARFTTFGDAGPVRTSDGAFAPASDHGADSGGLLMDPIDPRASIVTLRASLAVPAHTLDVDAIGVGLVLGGASAHVVPLAAVVVSAARGQVLLLLGETIAGTLPAPTDDLLHEYVLTIDPSGAVTVRAGGRTLSASVALPTAPLRALFFGRATNPSASATLPARIGELHVSTSGCDQPTALTRMGPITIIDHTAAAILSTATHPSIASDGTRVYLAFSAASMGDPTHGAIFIGVREGDGAFHVRAPTTGTQPLVVPAVGDSLESPALVDALGRWSLYATRLHAGVRSLVHTRSTSMHALAFEPLADVSAPDLVGDVSSPAPLLGDPTHLVARFRRAGEAGRGELVLLTLATSGASATPSAGLCGADVTCADGVRTQQHLYAARVSSIAFDADDVDDPAIVLYDHVYRLYYAGRLGSRWSIGMLIASDLGYWRAANGGAPVLAPQGVGFDAVSVRAPAPFVEASRLALYYVGSDGGASAIGLAAGSAVTN